MSIAETWQIAAHEARDVLADAALVAAWTELMRARPTPNGLYASPTWVAHLVNNQSARVRVWTVRDSSEVLVGVVPVSYHPHGFHFEIGRRTLHRHRLRVAELLGGAPALPNEPATFEQLVATVLADPTPCDGLYLDALPTDSSLWGVLHDSERLRRQTRLYIPNGDRPWHLVELAESFETYLKHLGSRTRSKLRRYVRLLREAYAGNVELIRCTQSEQVADFVHAAAAVSRRSWQNAALGPRVRDDADTRMALEDLADRGLLRSYLLRCGESALAFVIGHQTEGVYHYAEVGFDRAAAEHSPGIVLLYLILEDLHAHDRPDLLNFGVGDADYKRRFGTLVRRDASCLILRRGLKLHLLVAGHRLFRQCVVAVKRRVRPELPRSGIEPNHERRQKSDKKGDGDKKGGRGDKKGDGANIDDDNGQERDGQERGRQERGRSE